MINNPVGEVMKLVPKLTRKRPDFQFRKKDGQWECTCVIQIAEEVVRESSLAQTKKEAKAQSSQKILPVLRQYLEAAS